MSISCFVADLHLKPDTQPRQNARLRDFLRAIITQKARRLILLGDTFNFWFERNGRVVGDYQEIFSLFRNVAENGVTIDLLAGNRDFMFGSSINDAAYYPGFFRHRQNANALSQITTQAKINPRGFNCRFRQDDELIHCTHGDMYATIKPGHGTMRWWTMSLTARIFFAYAPFAVMKLLLSPIQKRETLPCRKWLPETELIDVTSLQLIVDDGVKHIFCGHFHYPYNTQIIAGKNHSATLHILPCWADQGEYAILENQTVNVYAG